MAAESAFIHIIISISILLFSAKIFAEIFQRIKQPVVLGELLAGIIVGPYALGGLPLFDGQPLVVLDETLKYIGELAAIVIFFIAGLEITPREFLRGECSIIYRWCIRSNHAIFCWLYGSFDIWTGFI